MPPLRRLHDTRSKFKPLNQIHLAIQGGDPTFPEGPPKWPVADDAIGKSINDALESGQWGFYEGDLTAQLHQSLQAEFQLSDSLLCSSGTISVELALRGVGVKSGDEVILCAYDFPGNFRSIEAIGAVPVLVDAVANGWVMDHEKVSEAISEKTSAVVVSHLHGQTGDIKSIADIVRPAGIKIVEDVCQSPGGWGDGQMLGAGGDVATFSFGGSKLLSAGRGGAILSNDEATIQRAKIFAHRGNDAFPLSQIQAALLLPQIKQLRIRNQRRHQAAEKVADSVNRLSGLMSLHIPNADNAIGAYYKLPIIIQKDSPFDRAKFLSAIQEEGVAMDVGFRGFAKRSTRRCRHAGSLENAAWAAENTMLLHHPILLSDDEQIDRLTGAIERCHKYCLEEQ